METMPQAWFVNLGIKIESLPRVFISVFNFDIYWYSIIICLGIIMGIIYAVHEAKRTGQNPEDYIDYFFMAFIFALVGARLYYVIFAWEIYSSDILSVFNLRNGGLAIYGGVIGGVVSAIVYSKRKNFNFWLLADTASPALILGQAIGRWANFFNKEAFGGYTESLFALRYKVADVLTISREVYDKAINVNGIDYIQVHPTFLYESICNFIIFILLNILKKRKKFDGEVVLAYFLCYGIIRFFIESLRTDQLILFGTGFPVSQVLSAALALGSALLIAKKRRQVV